jgi:hypothetical protein
VILYVEMRLQIIQNSIKLKFCVNVFVNIFQPYSCKKGSKNCDVNDIIQNNIMYFDDFLCCNEAANYRKFQ